MRQTLLFFLLASIVFTFPAYAKKNNQIALQLQWKHQFEFAGFYAAIEKGFYEEAGLDVQLFEYQEGVDQIQEVLSGRKEFGIWGDGLLRSYLQGKPLVLLANYFKRSPLILLTSPEIRTPVDLRGKKIMVSSMDAHSAGYLQMLRKFKIDPSEITVIPPSFDIQDFIDGKVDGYFAFSTNEPFLLRQQGVAYNVLDFNNYGSELYDVNLFTSKEYAQKNPEKVQAFIEASNRGWDYAIKHSDEIIDLILEEYNSQQKSREALLFEYRESLKVVLPDSYPIGSVDPEKIRTMGNVFGQVGLVVPLKNYQDFISQEWEKKKLLLTAKEQRFIEKHPVVTLGAADSSAPMIIANEDGSLSGIDVEIAQRIKERTGLELNFERGTWAGLLEKAKKHDIDGLAASVAHVEREKFFNFSTPYLSTNMAVIVKAGNPFQIKSVADLKGKRIAIQKDNLQMEKLFKSLGGGEIVHCSNAKELLEAVISERADCMIWHEGIMYMARVSDFSYVEVVFPVGNKVDVRYSLRKDWPELTTIIDKALHSISIQEISSIREKWSGLSNVQDSRYSSVKRNKPISKRKAA